MKVAILNFTYSLYKDKNFSHKGCIFTASIVYKTNIKRKAEFLWQTEKETNKSL